MLQKTGRLPLEAMSLAHYSATLVHFTRQQDFRLVDVGIPAQAPWRWAYSKPQGILSGQIHAWARLQHERPGDA
jgi:hypothetical protein